MILAGSSVLITGAAGGIGRALVVELLSRGARLGLVDRSAALSGALREVLRSAAGVLPLPADLTREDERQAVVARAADQFGGIDVLVNLAGWQRFATLDTHTPADIDSQLAVNLAAPMQLARLVLPYMLQHGGGRIVNVGSTFGSIGFPCFSAYSATKFGLRGFSEALRRELAGTGVSVCYFAPRATRTALNTDAVYRLAGQIGMRMDEPEQVARGLIAAIESDRKTCFVGWPEKLFVRVNSLLPGLVDGALRRTGAISRRVAAEN